MSIITRYFKKGKERKKISRGHVKCKLKNTEHDCYEKLKTIKPC